MGRRYERHQMADQSLKVDECSGNGLAGAAKVFTEKEYKALYALHLPVTEISLPQALNELQPDAGRIPFNKENKNYTLFSVLDIFGKYEYEEYKDKWNAGFQTGNSWPEKDFHIPLRLVKEKILAISAQTGN